MSDCGVARACPPRTPNRKKTQRTAASPSSPAITQLIGRSRSVRSTATAVRSRLPASSRKPSENAFAMIRQLRRIPMIPAAAMPPIPISLTVERKTCSGGSAASPAGAAPARAPAPPAPAKWETSGNQETNEPAQMMAE